jgi:polyribonucleotide nucleotidyltransferase
LFAPGFKCETQVVTTVLSHDLENDPDIVALVAASAALTLSGAPFMGPIGGARVGLVNGEFVLNPLLDERGESKLDLVVAGTGEAVLMVESEAKELSEDDMLGAVMFGHRGFQPVIDAIISLAEKAAKEPREYAPPDRSAIEEEMLGLAEADLREAYKITVKQDRYTAVDAVKARVMETFLPEGWRSRSLHATLAEATTRSRIRSRSFESRACPNRSSSWNARKPRAATSAHLPTLPARPRRDGSDGPGKARPRRYRASRTRAA